MGPASPIRRAPSTATPAAGVPGLAARDLSASEPRDRQWDTRRMRRRWTRVPIAVRVLSIAVIVTIVAWLVVGLTTGNWLWWLQLIWIVLTFANGAVQLAVWNRGGPAGRGRDGRREESAD
jgi:amino acid transporter